MGSTAAVSVPYNELDDLVISLPPELDASWLAYEKKAGLLPRPVNPPKKSMAELLERQAQYAEECRALNARLLAPRARYEHLNQGIYTELTTVPSRLDRAQIPVLKYGLAAQNNQPGEKTREAADDDDALEKTIIVYYHGGGLHVGEADSEDISCRQLLKAGIAGQILVYSVGYRLMPAYPARTCVSDAIDAFNAVRTSNPSSRFVIVGSSSGGQLAALVSQAADKDALHGVLLRCPVTSDAFSGMDYVPNYVRESHTSTAPEFATTLLGRMDRATPRDGLEIMPLEADDAQIKGMPRTWIQICTNDMLYSDGLTYAMALETVDVDVKVDAVWGFPHTFWLKAPLLERAVLADQMMVNALRWVLDEDVKDEDEDMQGSGEEEEGEEEEGEEEEEDDVAQGPDGDYTWKHTYGKPTV